MCGDWSENDTFWDRMTFFFDDAWDNPFELMTEIDFDSDN